MPVLREVREQDVGEERADVEPHGPVERELVVDHERRRRRAHDAPGVQVAVQQRGGVRRERVLQRRHFRLELDVSAERRRRRVQLRRGPLVVLRVAVRLGEDHLLGERAHRLVLPERLPLLAQALAPDRQSAAPEERRRQILAGVLGEERVRLARHDAAPEDDVRRLQEPHRDHGHRGVVQEHLGDVRGAEAVRGLQRLGFVPHALLRQRPGLAHDAHERQALLDDDGVSRGGAAHDVDEVDVPVAHFLRGPVLEVGLPAESGGDAGLGRAVLQHGVDVHRVEARCGRGGGGRIGDGRVGGARGSRHELAHLDRPVGIFPHHTLLGDDPGDQARGGDVERGVPDADAVSGDARAPDVRDLLCGPILDDDVVPVLRARVQRGHGRGDEERDAVVRAGDRQVVGADFVRGVSVVGDAVGAHHDGVHLLLPHQARRRRVADERPGHLFERNLVRGEPRALVVRPSLVAVDVLQHAALAQTTNHAQSGAVAGGGERTGVAVRQDAQRRAGRLADGGAQRVRAESADRAVRRDIVRQHGLALRDDLLRRVRARRARIRECARRGFQPLHSLAQVHRGWPAGEQVVQLLRDERGRLRGAREARLGRLEVHGERERGGDRDRGRAAHVHVADHGPARVAIGDVNEHGLAGELQLVEQLQRTARVADRLERGRGRHRCGPDTDRWKKAEGSAGRSGRTSRS